MSARGTPPEGTKQEFALARGAWSLSAVLGAVAAVLFATVADNVTLALVFGGFAVLSVALALTFGRRA